MLTLIFSKGNCLCLQRYCTARGFHGLLIIQEIQMELEMEIECQVDFGYLAVKCDSCNSFSQACNAFQYLKIHFCAVEILLPIKHKK